MAKDKPLIKDSEASNRFSYLFNEFNPAYSNLFEINIEGSEIFPEYSLYATGVNFKGDSLSLKRHEVSKLFTLEKYNRSDIITINWREDDKFSVKKFHMDWISKFYNRKIDRYVSYPTAEEAKTNLFKKFKIKLQEGYELILEDVLPQNIPDLNLNWSGPEVLSYSSSYVITSWDWKEPTEGM